MPDSTPWTQGELVRAVTNVMATLNRIEGKLEDRPDWADINRMEAARNKEQATQDVALKNLEERMARAFSIGVGGVLTGLTAAGGWLVSLLSGG